MSRLDDVPGDDVEGLRGAPWKRFVLTLAGFWLVLYGSFTLVNPPLLDDADSVHAEVAREMVVGHDWVTLYANGVRYLEKAPLMYWSMAASFKLFGVSDAAARLPLVLYALALFLLIFLLGRELFVGGESTGFYASLILTTSFGMFIFTHLTLPDTMVCLWTTAALFFFRRGVSTRVPSWQSATGFAAACALNVLTKGLIGVVFPLGIVLVYLFVTKNVRFLVRWHPVAGAIVFLLIAVPWHVLAALRNPGFGHPGAMPTDGNVHGWFWFYFVNEQLLRYLNLRVPHDYDTVPLVLFWGLLLVWLMPWAAFLGKAMGRVPWKLAFGRRPMDREQQAWVLLAIWALLPLVFFSFSTRQEYYALPSLAPFALMIGRWLALDEEGSAGTREALAGRRIALMLLVLGICGAIVTAWLGLRVPRPTAGADLAKALSENPGAYALSFGHFLDLSSRAMGFFRGPLMDTAAALFVGTLGHFFYRTRGNARYANLFLAGMAAAFLLAAHLALQIFAPVLSSQALAAAVHRDLQPGDVLEINGEYEAGSSMAFYLRRQVRILNGRSSNLWYGSFFPDAPHIFDDSASFARLWAGDRRVWLWTEADTAPALPGAVVIARDGGKEIISNRRNQSGASF